MALTGLGILAASMLILAWLGGLPSFTLGLIAFGIGSGVMFAAAVPWLDEGFGDLDKGFAYGSLNLFYAIGYAVGPIAAGVGLEVGGPRLVYLPAAALLLAVAAFVFARRRLLPD